MSKARFVIEEANWNDAGQPIEWAVWDRVDRKQYGQVTWKRKETAQAVAKVLNRSMK